MFDSFNAIPALIFTGVGMILGYLIARWRFAKLAVRFQFKAAEIARQVDALVARDKKRSTTEYRGRTK